ncbi:hypothetical protein ONS95_009307 [Cadophora gregata]|uniref:uncharacterized protein n=1 Tax=Cadophora gregata TaxID=51156 RepID=UPI0026DCCDE3|nr:uncharacterized protein ONS95_009307 [Cadophora gregata]KAK0124339.1 hypothetical protein ONS95_009307 [Cadophora gregata]
MTSFHAFGQLPPELRLRVWIFALPPPRVIELTWMSRARSVTSKSGAPAILHACRESRYSTIQFYQQIQFGYCSQAVLLDFDRDTLFFGPGCRHLVPSGKSNPWVMQNRKVIRDIKSSVSLQQNLVLAAFDCDFLLSMEDSEQERALHDILDGMEKLTDVVVVKTVHGSQRTMDGSPEPVLSDARMDSCISRLEIYNCMREGRSKVALNKAVYKSISK